MVHDPTSHQDFNSQAGTEAGERECAEQALRESEEHLSALFNQTLCGIAETDAKGIFLLVNDRYCTITGYAREELIGRLRMQELTHPDDLPRYLALFARCVTEGIPFEIEKCYLRKDGSLVWVNNTISAIRRSDGSTQSILSVTLDITERKQAEETQRACEVFSQSVLGSLPAQIAVLDQEGTIIAVNTAWTNVTLEHGGEDDLRKTGIGVNYLEVCRRVTGEDAVDAEQVERGLHAVLTGAQSQFTFEYPCHSPTKQRWFTLCGRPLLRSAGGAVVSHMDTTERKLAELGLRASEERFRAIVNQASAGICRAEISGKLIQVNQKMGEMLGYSRDELIGKTIWEITFRDDLSENKSLFERLKNTGQSFELEKRLIRKGGNPIWVNVSVAAINNNDGKPESTVAVVIDIDVRKRAEEAIRDREERLRLAVEAAEGGSFTFYYDDRQNEADERTLMLFGFKPGEWQGDEESVFARLVPADRAAVQQTIAQAIEQHLPYHSEFRVNLPDGSVRWLIGRGKAEYDVHGKPVLMRGMNLDITDRKQTEEALRTSQSTLAAALASMTDAVFISDTEGRFLEFNEAFATFHKFRNKNECARTLQEYPAFLDVYFPNGEAAPLEQWAVPRALRGETVVNAEYHLRRKDTGASWIGSYNFAPIRDQNGKIVGSIVVGHDITTEKQAQQSLHDNEARISSIVNSAMDAIVTVDAEQNIVLFNPAAEQMFQCAAADAIGQPLDRFIPTRYRDTHRQHHVKFGEDGSTQRSMNGFGTVYGLRANGEEFPLEASISKASVNGTKFFTAILRDITERKMAEAALQHAHNSLAQTNVLLQTKERERDRLMRRLITVQEEERQRLSWELHDQTSQHLVALRMLLTTMSEPLESQPEQRATLAQVQQLAEQLGHELHTLAWNLRPTRLQERGLATALAEYVQEWAARTQITADFHCRGDKRRRFSEVLEITVYRVVQEALTNVLKHAQARQVSVLLEYFPLRLRVVIEDDGVGFDPHQSEARNGATHLGLVSMRERLALVEGELEIESAPGQGTAIYLRIPLPNSELFEGTK